MNKKLQKKLSNSNLCIVSHIFATGPALELEEYLKDKVNSLLFIGHYFPFAKKQGSFYRKYFSKKSAEFSGSLAWKMPSSIIYFKEFIYTILTVIRAGETIDLFIGSDSFSSFMGLVLKKMGLVEEVIFYSIDYSPKRFTNPILNYLYYYFDRISLKYCKIVWNVSDRISIARREFFRLDLEECVEQITVPLGAWIDRIPYIPIEKRNNSSIVFMGHLLEKQGVQLVIEAFPEILKKIPKATLKIIGSGSYEASLKSLVKKYSLKNKISFLGYLENHEEVESNLSTAQIAIATYKPDPDSFTYFADPGKIKNYLACGLPVVLTNVPAIAGIIEKKKCGLITAYNIKDVASAITTMLLDKKRLKECSKNSRKFARSFDWNSIFSSALEKSLF